MRISMEKLTGALVLITALGVYVGFDALHEYKRSNIEAANARIAQIDRDVYTISINNDKFDSLFAYLPDANSAEEVKKNSKILLSLAVDEELKDQIPEIESIEGLYDLLYSATSYHDSKYKAQLRNAFTHADLIFYVVAEAHGAFVSDLMEDSSYKTWAAYAFDVGTNPLFLMSVFLAHKFGYVDKTFAHEIREILMNNKRTSIVVKTLLPEMYNDKNWADKVGDQYIKNHTPTKYGQ